MLILLVNMIGSLYTPRHLLIYFQREMYLLDANSGISRAYQSDINSAGNDPLTSPDGRWRVESVRNSSIGVTTLYLTDNQQDETTILATYSVIPLNPLGIIWLNDNTAWVLALDFDNSRTDTLLLQFDLVSAQLLTEYRYSRLSPLSWMPSPNRKFFILLGQQRVFPYQQAFIIDLSTGEDVLGGSDIFAPSWSPDGEWLFYETELNGQRVARWVNFVTGQTMQIPKAGALRLLAGWSPDSRWSAYENIIDGVAGVSIMNNATGENHVILESPYDLVTYWSPQSHYLLIVERLPQSTRLWVSQHDYIEPQLIDTLPSSITGVRWSADEKMLVYHIRDDDTSVVRVYDVVDHVKRDVLHSERVFRVEWLENQ